MVNDNSEDFSLTRKKSGYDGDECQVRRARSPFSPGFNWARLKGVHPLSNYFEEPLLKKGQRRKGERTTSPGFTGYISPRPLLINHETEIPSNPSRKPKVTLVLDTPSAKGHVFKLGIDSGKNL
jgi:hypothetical protein